jgi:hypothetical protein
VNRFGVVQNLVGKLRAGQFDAAFLAGVRALLGVNFFLQGAVEFPPGERRPLPGHRLQHAAGVARGNSLAQLVHILAALELNAAVLAFVIERPFREGSVTFGEVVGQAGVGVDLRCDDVNMRIILVVVGDKQRLGVAHAERFKRRFRRPFHLLAARRLAARPGERQVQAIIFALLGAALLVERVKLHHAARQVGIGRVRDVETEAGAAHPCDPALRAGGQLFQFAGLVIAPLPEHIAHRSGDALAGF